MPFSIRDFEDEKVAKIGSTECAKHDLMQSYPVLYEKEGEYVAQFKCTAIIMPNGIYKITGIPLDNSTLKCDLKIDNSEFLVLLNEPLKQKKKKGGGGDKEINKEIENKKEENNNLKKEEKVEENIFVKEKQKKSIYWRIKTKILKIKDEISSDEDGEGDDDGEQNEKSKNGKKKKDGKKGKKSKSEKDENKTKKQRVKAADEIAVESRSRAVKNVDKMMEQNSGTKIRADIDAADASDDSDFDEAPDSSKVNSVLFMQDKRKLNPPVSSSQQRKRQEPGGSSESQPSSSISEQPETKRAKMFYIFQ